MPTFPKSLYGFIALTGGALGALDRTDGANLIDQDLAIGVVAGKVHQYWLDEDSGLDESPPDVIAPDTNPDLKRWILTSIGKLTGDLDANNHSINNVSGINLTPWQDVLVAPYFKEKKNYDVESGRAQQGVAVDDTYFYLFGSTMITKYLKSDGSKVTENLSLIEHVGDGCYYDDKIYAAHCNYPTTPGSGTVCLYKASDLSYIESHDLGTTYGWATSIVRHNGFWWISFDKDDSSATYLVKYNDSFVEQQSYEFPAEVEALGTMGIQGIEWIDDFLYATVHGNYNYILKLTIQDSSLLWLDKYSISTGGQGIAWDSQNRQLLSVDRGNNKVYFSRFSPYYTPISTDQWGYVGALTTHPIGGDGTAGRILRGISISIKNGTNASTLKCRVTNQWNGDVIAETDNIIKDATTGDFSLDSFGMHLYLEVSGLSGNCVYAHGILSRNASGTAAIAEVTAVSNKVHMILRDASTDAGLDLTTLVDTGDLYLLIMYVTDA